jgi:hypothetical protein
MLIVSCLQGADSGASSQSMADADIQVMLHSTEPTPDDPDGHVTLTLKHTAATKTLAADTQQTAAGMQLMCPVQCWSSRAIKCQCQHRSPMVARLSSCTHSWCLRLALYSYAVPTADAGLHTSADADQGGTEAFSWLLPPERRASQSHSGDGALASAAQASASQDGASASAQPDTPGASSQSGSVTASAGALYCNSHGQTVGCFWHARGKQEAVSCTHSLVLDANHHYGLCAAGHLKAAGASKKRPAWTVCQWDGPDVLGHMTVNSVPML